MSERTVLYVKVSVSWLNCSTSTNAFSLHGSTVPGSSTIHWGMWQIEINPHIQSHDAWLELTLGNSNNMLACHTAPVTSEMLRFEEKRCLGDEQFCCECSLTTASKMLLFIRHTHTPEHTHVYCRPDVSKWCSLDLKAE